MFLSQSSPSIEEMAGLNTLGRKNLDWLKYLVEDKSCVIWGMMVLNKLTACEG